MSASFQAILFTSASPLPINEVRARLYPEQVWYFVACSITFVCLGNLAYILSAWRREHHARTVENTRGDIEDQSHHGTKSISWRRLYSATVNAWRIAILRSVIHLGRGYTFSVCE